MTLRTLFNALNRLEYTLNMALPVSAIAAGNVVAQTAAAAGTGTCLTTLAYHGGLGLVATASLSAPAFAVDIVEGYLSSQRTPN